MSTEKRLKEFLEDLPILESGEMVTRHIVSRTSCVLGEAIYADLKREIGSHFEEHDSNVVMVGSAKLGFSIKDTKRYISFGNESDIDIAIVSESLFATVWTTIFELERSGYYWEKRGEFRRYHYKGWIRPDKLPNPGSFGFAKDWWEFFRSLTTDGKYGPYKISAGLYYSWYFLEAYQRKCIEQCKAKLELIDEDIGNEQKA